MVKFSFVVPACNVGPYAERMIRSLQAQTVSDFEAIIASEESKDDTLENLRRAIGDDPRFQLKELPCSGSASISRNYGMEHATGEYLVFVDGDDWIEPDTLERFGEAVERFGHPDLLLADWVIHRRAADGSETVTDFRCHYLEPNRVYTGFESLAIRLESYFQPGSPANICRREFLLENRLFQLAGRRHQDCEWMPRVNFAARSVVYLPFNYYHYRKRAESVTTKPNPRSIRDFTDNIISFWDFWDANKIPERLRRPLADWCGENFDCFFGARYAADYPAKLRRDELKRLLGGGGIGRARRVLRYGGASKRVLILLLELSRLPGGFGLAGAIYRKLYKGTPLSWLRGLKRRCRGGGR